MKTAGDVPVLYPFLVLLDICCKILSDVSEVTYFKQDPVISWRRMGQRGKKRRK